MASHIPFHQRLLTWALYLSLGFFTLGTALDAISNAISLLTPSTTYAVATVIVILWVWIEFHLRLRPIKWIAAGNREIRLCRLGIKPRLIFIGVILLLFTPRAVNLWRNSQEVENRIKVQLEQDRLPSQLSDLGNKGKTFQVVPPSHQNFQNVLQTRKSKQDFQSLLFLAAQELRNDNEYLRRVSAYLKNPNIDAPVGTVQYENTLLLFNKYYAEITRDSYGEEKYLYQHVIWLRDTASVFATLGSRQDLLDWNDTSEMTVDDFAFLTGFLNWYVSIQAMHELPRNLTYSINEGSLMKQFVGDADVGTVKMRGFTHEGQPITNYCDYLSLID
ncbi:MAG: hypothetical protein H0V27_03785 [Pyrinomonadaceae bacterium]|nr:hypothetical protein [Pyrinomonadaceae bacterium]